MDILTDKNVKVVSFKGGLGNQMFQYAFGLALAQKTKCKVLYDASFYDTKFSKLNFHRQFYLDVFDIVIPMCSKKEVERFSKLGTIFYEKLYYHFDDEVFRSKKVIFDGYWQNEKYFCDVAKTVRRAFKFPSLEDDFNKKNLLKIQKCPNSVAIHVRRGDYLFQQDWVLPLEYYRKAAQYIASKVSNPKFFVFTNEPNDNFREMFDLGFDYELIDNVNEKKDEDWKDLCLMASCKHKIISNSSFSWWAAWLSDSNENGELKTGQIVCAPSPWLYGSSNFTPSRWHKIKWNANYREHIDLLIVKCVSLQKQLNNVKNSKSYKIGRFATYPLRKIREMLRKKTKVK